MPKFTVVRRRLIASLGAVASLALVHPIVASTSASEATLMRRFSHLNQNGNSNCSAKFMKSIADMPAEARLQGSCCAPMDAHRYIEQVRALRKFSTIPEIPSDPYDVPAHMAQKLMGYYDLLLNVKEQAAYDHAMANSDEQGPCCCQCWRWYVYGGLGKFLVHERGFDGPRLVEVWNFSSGCGGAEHHH